MVCVNDPQFNDIAREIFFNSAWESWLSDHLVKAMINYPEAVLLGKLRTRTTLVKLQLAEYFRHWIKYWASQSDGSRNGQRGCCLGRGLLQLREEYKVVTKVSA